MPYIRSANQSKFDPLFQPGTAKYAHGAESRRGYIPLAFQITSPYDKLRALLPHALIAHVNPRSFAETFNKKVERIQTRGGFVEQHWGDDLGEISVDQSTGAFINLYTGLSSVLRHRTIAWDRYRDLYDLYRNNASVYDPFGNIVLQGYVMLMYDRGTYLGYFRSFSVEEAEETPFAFNMSWNFKVVETLYQIPLNGNFIGPRPAAFQFKNQTSSTGSGLAGGVQVETKTAGELKAEADAEAANEKLAASAAKIKEDAQANTVQGKLESFGKSVFGVGEEPKKPLPGKVPTPPGTPVKK
jgi:hypothetical protein